MTHWPTPASSISLSKILLFQNESSNPTSDGSQLRSSHFGLAQLFVRLRRLGGLVGPTPILSLNTAPSRVLIMPTGVHVLDGLVVSC